MLGWFNECLEKLLIDKFSQDLWDQVKQRAKEKEASATNNASANGASASSLRSSNTSTGSSSGLFTFATGTTASNNGGGEREDNGFVRLDCTSYADEFTWQLLEIAEELTESSPAELLEAMGEFFFHSILIEDAEAEDEEDEDKQSDGYIHSSGTANTLKDWLNLFNSINQSALPPEVCQEIPQFFCEELLEEEPGQDGGGLVLYHWSSYGSQFDPFIKGFVSELAGILFQLEDIVMELKQEKDGDCYTRWRISTLEPADSWKLYQRASNKKRKRTVTTPTPTTTKCPMTGLTVLIPPHHSSTPTEQQQQQQQQQRNPIQNNNNKKIPHQQQQQQSNGSNNNTGKQQIRWDEDIDSPENSPTNKNNIKNNKSKKNKNNNKKKKQKFPNQQKRCVVATPTTTTTTTTTTQQQQNGFNNNKSKPGMVNTAATEATTSSATAAADGIGLSPTITKSIFPYHIMINEKFIIQQVGNSLSSLLNLSASEDDEDTDFLVNKNIATILKFYDTISSSSPEQQQQQQHEWNWDWLRMRQEQSFLLETIPSSSSFNNIPYIRFQASIVQISQPQLQQQQQQQSSNSSIPIIAMLILTPDTNSMQELQQYNNNNNNNNLTLCDIPFHTGHRDLVLAKEQLTMQKNNAQTMESLQESLEREKELLESLLPHHAAEGLRAGKMVEPRLHGHCTFFFSDIVGFTNICKQLKPRQVIDMLNRLYSVMDFLCGKFQIFKIETIGDAYVAVSGLPEADPNHAHNLANFAIAVNHCTRKVLSPLDNKTPIQLRIGIHTGPSASGVVGTTNPRYCVFGDTVNTTSRHESSGLPGKIHCSSSTRKTLESKHGGLFDLEERGLIEMKGKGSLTTHWLNGGTTKNLAINAAALEQLDAEVEAILAATSLGECDNNNVIVEITREVRNERNKRMTILKRSSGIAFNSNISTRIGLGGLDDLEGSGNNLRRKNKPLRSRVTSTLRKIGNSENVVIKKLKKSKNATKRMMGKVLEYDKFPKNKPRSTNKRKEKDERLTSSCHEKQPPSIDRREGFRKSASEGRSIADSLSDRLPMGLSADIDSPGNINKSNKKNQNRLKKSKSSPDDLWQMDVSCSRNVSGNHGSPSAADNKMDKKPPRKVKSTTSCASKTSELEERTKKTTRIPAAG